MDVLGWIFFGLIIGLIGKLAMPEQSPQGFLFTALLGIAGALIGGFLGRSFGWFHTGEPAGFALAVIGSIVLLALYRVLIRRRL